MARFLLPMLLVAAVVLMVMLVTSAASALAGRRSQRRQERRSRTDRRAADRERLESLVVTARARRSLAVGLLADPLVDQVDHDAVADLLAALDALPAVTVEELEGPSGPLRRAELDTASRVLDDASTLVSRRLGRLRSLGGGQDA